MGGLQSPIKMSQYHQYPNVADYKNDQYFQNIIYNFGISANIAVWCSTYFNYDELSPMHNSNSRYSGMESAITMLNMIQPNREYLVNYTSCSFPPEYRDLCRPAPALTRRELYTIMEIMLFLPNHWR